MQTSVPDLVDFSGESPAHAQAGYGPDALTKGTFANNCLIARRLLERGRAVRAVDARGLGPARQSLHATRSRNAATPKALGRARARPERARHARRHARRVGWRVRPDPVRPGRPASPKGRDHFGKAYSWWLAGGGVKPGTVYGSTDDFAWNITADPVHVHDMQATILHLCGIDHTRLTFRYQGRQYRLTDVSGKVVKGDAGLTGGAHHGPSDRRGDCFWTIRTQSASAGWRGTRSPASCPAAPAVLVPAVHRQHRRSDERRIREAADDGRPRAGREGLRSWRRHVLRWVHDLRGAEQLDSAPDRGPTVDQPHHGQLGDRFSEHDVCEGREKLLPSADPAGSGRGGLLPRHHSLHELLVPGAGAGAGGGMVHDGVPTLRALSTDRSRARCSNTRTTLGDWRAGNGCSCSRGSPP